MGALDSFEKSMMTLVLVAIIIAALAIANNAFQDSIEDDKPCEDATATFNDSFAWGAKCRNQSGGGSAVLGGESYQYNTTEEGLAGVSNATSYLSTIGTLLGVAALIAIVVSAFMFVRR